MVNGIDTSRYVCDEQAHLEAKEQLGVSATPVFGNVGRLTEQKNHAFLLEVFKLIHDELPNAVLLLVGRGELEDAIRQKACDLDLADAVRFLGVRDDIPTVLNAMDVFLFPSYIEGLGIAALEAQASGLPCVVSDGLPPLAIASPKTTQIPLAKGAEAWARQALNDYRSSQEAPRSDCVAHLREHGYDIHDTAEWLADFYLETAHKLDRQ